MLVDDLMAYASSCSDLSKAYNSDRTALHRKSTPNQEALCSSDVRASLESRVLLRRQTENSTIPTFIELSRDVTAIALAMRLPRYVATGASDSLASASSLGNISGNQP